MTREEREKFVHDTIFGCHTLNDAIRTIVARWEDDSDDAFQRGVWAGQESKGAQG